MRKLFSISVSEIKPNFDSNKPTHRLHWWIVPHTKIATKPWGSQWARTPPSTFGENCNLSDRTMSINRWWINVDPWSVCSPDNWGVSTVRRQSSQKWLVLKSSTSGPEPPLWAFQRVKNQVTNCVAIAWLLSTGWLVLKSSAGSVELAFIVTLTRTWNDDCD